MCGRFAFSPFAKIIEERFHVLIDESEYKPRYNSAPGQDLAVILNNEQGKLSFCRWGLIPFWSKDSKIGFSLINARAETIKEKPAFKSPFHRKRCLVPADSFYEWKVINNKKTPYRIFLKDEPLFSMAGIWDSWNDKEGNTITSFTIITTEANSFMRKIHDRMPVILKRDDEAIWLGNNNVDALSSLLKKYPSELMGAYEISERVNNPRNDDEKVIQSLNKKPL